MEFAFFPSPSPMEIMVIAVIALIVLGPSRLPEAARSLGKGLKEMRDSFQGGNDDEREGYERLDEDGDDGDLDDADLEALDEYQDEEEEPAGRAATARSD